MHNVHLAARCGSTTCLFIMLLLMSLLGSTARAQSPTHDLDLRVAGVKIKVTDMDEALVFYHDLLGFTVLTDAQAPDLVILETNQWPLFLERASHPAQAGFPRASQTSLSLQSYDLAATMAEMKKHGVVFDPDPATPYGVNQEGAPLGLSTKLIDPFGNVLSMVEQQRGRGEAFASVQVYNAGFYLPDVEVARAFYCGVLGFLPMTEQYYPNIPLLHPDESFGFMLHGRVSEEQRGGEPMQEAQARYPDDAQLLLVFTTPDLPDALAYLKQNGVSLLHDTMQGAEGERRFIAFKDPFGNVSELHERDP